MKTLSLLVLILFLSGCGVLEGDQGIPGVNGSSCSVQTVSNGALITCTDGTASVVLNGNNGIDGLNGQDGKNAPPTAYTIIEIIDPCGKQTAFDEVLLRMENGQLLAHYANGNIQFLTLVGPGNYVTTDGSNCYFAVTSDLKVKW